MIWRLDILLVLVHFVCMTQTASVQDISDGEHEHGKQGCYQITYWDSFSQKPEYCVALCFPGGGQQSECSHLCQDYLQCMKRAYAQTNSLRSSSSVNIRNFAAKQTNQLATQSEEKLGNEDMAIVSISIVAAVLSVVSGLVLILRWKGIRRHTECVKKGGVPPEGDTIGIAVEEVEIPLCVGTADTYPSKNSSRLMDKSDDNSDLYICVKKGDLPPDGDTGAVDHEEGELVTPLWCVGIADKEATKAASCEEADYVEELSALVTGGNGKPAISDHDSDQSDLVHPCENSAMPAVTSVVKVEVEVVADYNMKV